MVAAQGDIGDVGDDKAYDYDSNGNLISDAPDYQEDDDEAAEDGENDEDDDYDTDAKGQLISKKIFSVFNFPKKRT